MPVFTADVTSIHVCEHGCITGFQRARSHTYKHALKAQGLTGDLWHAGLRADMGGACLATRLSCAPEQAAML